MVAVIDGMTISCKLCYLAYWRHTLLLPLVAIIHPTASYTSNVVPQVLQELLLLQGNIPSQLFNYTKLANIMYQKICSFLSRNQTSLFALTIFISRRKSSLFYGIHWKCYQRFFRGPEFRLARLTLTRGARENKRRCSKPAFRFWQTWECQRVKVTKADWHQLRTRTIGIVHATRQPLQRYSVSNENMTIDKRINANVTSVEL